METIKEITGEIIKVFIALIFFIAIYYPVLWLHQKLGVGITFSLTDSVKNDPFIYYLNFCIFLLGTMFFWRFRKMLIDKISKPKIEKKLNNA